ncbi:methionine/alanine import family NSS transporter small subunit [Nocardioides daphniae]|uniref:Methionine/alanine import family NSS transporter small subunit n=1 Tax=Nocardioides daphniae TaxID=402297 RepID=A0A4P7U7Z4_9ACTN|nr:methionine/alanine import family NSS transporter small subunit [Nocardioides daphniae]QCC76106.1 methionine/alanine import family NSS transporter small subunit [Nocardioides daphniae]GGD10111.1 hypothetical protein GCM10007231_06140 [Nocardioides daphniae]
MSTVSIVMMIISMLVLWGGLVLAIVLLLRNDRRTGHGADPGVGVRPGGEHFTRDL